MSPEPYKQIKRIADCQLNEDTLRSALAGIVNAISTHDIAQVWGTGETSSSDGQRFIFPRKSVRQTYSHRLGDYALEFYSFITDNYAPFYTTPIEATERGSGSFSTGFFITNQISILQNIIPIRTDTPRSTTPHLPSLVSGFA